MRPFLITATILLILVLAVNGIAAWDQRALETRIRAAAIRFGPGQALLASRYVDERRFQKARIESISRPQVVAFGSSRVRPISTETLGLPREGFYNTGMGEATVEDYIALWWNLRVGRKMPKVAHVPVQVVREYVYVYAAVAPVQGQMVSLILPETSTEMMNLFLEHARETHFAGSGIAQEALYRWYQAKEMLSYTVLTASLKELERMQAGRKKRGIEVYQAFTNDIVPESAVAGRSALRADGSVIPPASARDQSSVAIQEKAVQYMSPAPRGLANFRWDTRRARRLELLWMDMRSHGLRIVAYLPPYHPVVWERMRQDRRYESALEETNGFLTGLSSRLGVRFLDASDPASIPCSPEEFTDGDHPNEACLSRLLERLGVRTRSG